MKTPAPVRLSRSGIDWQRVYREGLRVELSGELPEGSFFVAPFDERRDIIVVMVPCPRALVNKVKTSMLSWASILRGGQGLWGLLQKIGTGG